MIGYYGSELPLDGDYTQAKSRYGRYFYFTEGGEGKIHNEKSFVMDKTVHILEGSFVATNVDIPWDEDMDNDFLLAAQCLRYREAGYEVCAAWQEKPILIFEGDENFTYHAKKNFTAYNKAREKFCKAYLKQRMPLVSILIPAYNQPKFFQEALESAINQTYQNIEILIGDDSTNDEVKEVAAPYLEKYSNIKYYQNDGSRPRGGKHNMHFLLNICNGDYIAYLLHDDLFYPEKIYKMMTFFVEDLEEKIALITSARDSIDAESKVVDKMSNWIPPKDTILSGKMIGRQIGQKARFVN